MAPRLTRGEFWILNSLVEHRDYLYRFHGPDRFLQDHFNRTPHGLSEDEVVLTVLGMFNAGWIGGEVARRDGPEKATFEPTGTAIREALNPVLYRRDGDPPRRPRRQDPQVTIGLTPAGGAVWEAFAAPRWHDFVDDFWRYEGSRPNRTEWRVFRATSRDRGKAYARCFADVDGFDPADIEWKNVTPFPATYWKTLPVGAVGRLRCPSRFNSGPWTNAEYWNGRYRQALAWQRSQSYRRWRDWEW